VHEGVEVLEVLDAVRGVEVGLYRRPGVHEPVAVARDVQQVQDRLSLVAVIWGRGQSNYRVIEPPAAAHAADQRHCTHAANSQNATINEMLLT
jgi:hypothetical protein